MIAVGGEVRGPDITALPSAQAFAINDVRDEVTGDGVWRDGHFINDYGVTELGWADEPGGDVIVTASGSVDGVKAGPICRRVTPEGKVL